MGWGSTYTCMHGLSLKYNCIACKEEKEIEQTRAVYFQVKTWLKLRKDDAWHIGPIQLDAMDLDFDGSPWWILVPEEWINIGKYDHDSGWRSIDRVTARALLYAAEVYAREKEKK